MIGDSDNEVGAGESPVPTETPEPRGEPAYRPFRGWSMAEPKPPSVWSRLRASLAGMFARKPKEAQPDDEQQLLEGQAFVDEAASGPSAMEEMDVEWKDEVAEPATTSDDAFFYPEPEPPTPQPELTAEPPSAAPTEAEPPFIAEQPVMAEPPVAPPVDFKFPFARTEEEHDAFDAAWHAAAPPPAEPLAEGMTFEAPEPVADEMAFEAPEPVADEMAFEAPEPAADEPAFEAPEPVAEEESFVTPEPVSDVRRPTPTDWLERIEHTRAADSMEPVGTGEEPPSSEPQTATGEDDFQPVMRVLQEPQPGFFARLFGRGKRKAEPVVEEEPLPVMEEGAAPVMEEEAPPVMEEETAPVMEDVAPPVVEDLPLITEFEAKEPTLDDALPMEIASVPEEALDQPPESLDEPSFQPWSAAAREEPVAEELTPQPESGKKRGFFARLFGRKQQEPESFAEAEELVETDAGGAAEELTSTPDAYSAFEEDAQVAGEAQPQTFASVEDALPLDTTFAEPMRAVPPEPMPGLESTMAEPTPIALPFARTLEPDAEPAAVAPPDMTFMFDSAPPPSFAQDIGAEPVSDSRSTLEVEQPAAEEERTTGEMPVVEEETTGEMVPPPVPEVTAQAEAERPPFFVPKFRAFYNEIVHYKQQKSEFTAGFSTAIVDYHADLSADAAAQSLSTRLQQILELQAAEATWMGGEAAARFPDAQYAMAVMADELFTYLEWPGKEAWPKFLLEPRLFRTQAADVEFFKRLDKLLKDERDNPSPAAKDLARMYLLILAAGFQGKYRPFNLPRALADYRRRLYEFVYGKDPLLIYGDDRRLFPETMERTVAGRAVSRFSLLQQWAAVLLLLILGYAVVSQVAWNRVSAELKDVTARVEAANASTTSDGVDAPVQK